jgi:hypothetical protein
MTMQVTIDPQLSSFLFMQMFHKALDVKDFRLKFFIRLYPLSIEINSSNRASIISAHYPIRIQSRYQNERIEFSEELSLLMIGAKKVKDPFENEASRSLGCMNSTSYYYDGLLFVSFTISTYGDHLQRQATNTSTQFFSLIEDTFTLDL